MQPRLQNPQAKENAYDCQEHTDLVQKHGKVTLADGIIDAALPVVELYLCDCVCPDNKRDKNKKLSNAVL